MKFIVETFGTLYPVLLLQETQRYYASVLFCSSVGLLWVVLADGLWVTVTCLGSLLDWGT